MLKKLISLFALAWFTSTSCHADEYSLKPVPEHHEVVLNGTRYEFQLFQYDPPLAFVNPDKNRAESDLSTPEGTFRSILSSMWNDPEWFWSLMDEDTRHEDIARDKEREPGQRITDLWPPQPARTDLRDLPIGYEELIYKVEFTHENRQYAAIITRYKNGKSFGLGEMYFIKEKAGWYLSLKPREHPLVRLASGKDFDEFIDFLKTGSVFPEQIPPITGELRTSKTSYEMGEPIEFTFTMKNVSKEPVSVFVGFTPMGRAYSILLEKDGKGDSIGAIVMSTDTNPEDFKVLQPGQSVEDRYTLRDYTRSDTGKISAEKTNGGQVFTLPEGQISALADYMPSPYITQAPNAPANIFTGIIQTERVVFEIRPKSAEQASSSATQEGGWGS